MATSVGRFRSVRLSKNIRRRRDSDEEPVNIDFSRPAGANVQEFLWRACQREGGRGQKLAYLNALAKVLAGVDEQQDLVLTREELIYCLRIPLLNETKEVRAAGYRVLRYLVKTAEDVRNLIKLQIPLLMVRSLDLVLDNSMERLQSLRLARRLLSVAPAQFPDSLTRCLVAMAAAGPLQRDKLWMLTVATLAQLCISAGALLCRCGGVHVLLRCVLDCYQPRATDAVLSVLFGLVGRPGAEWPDLSLLLAPLADPHYGHHAVEPDIGRSNPASDEEVVRSAQVALLSVLRSWPGLLLISSRHAGALGALVDSLQLNRPELRRALIDMLFELVGRDPPDSGKTPEAVVKEFLDGGISTEHCRLYGGFVAEEARLFLPHLGDTRPDLVMNHQAVLLYILLELGLLQALVEVVVTGDRHLSLAATLLIGDVLHRANEILPIECSRFSNCLPTLLSRANECGPTERTVTETVSLLSRLHAARRRDTLHPGASLYLRQQALYCSRDRPTADDLFQRAVNDTGQVRVRDACLQSLLTESKLTSSEDPAVWSWPPIRCLVKMAARQHGAAACAAMARLCRYLEPARRQFSRQSVSGATSELQTSVMVDLMTTLLDTDASVCSSCCHLLEAVVSSIAGFLRRVVAAEPGSDEQISANSLINTHVQYYFLLIGCVSGNPRGLALLDQHSFTNILLDLTRSANGEYYVKLVVSSLDYSQGEWAWNILEQCLAAEEEGKRLYVTLFLRLLARERCPGFARWGVQCLGSLLRDSAERVAAAALSVLEEACDHEPYLEAVVSLHPAVLSLGDGGVLLFARLLSVPAEHRMFHRLNFVSTQLDRWRDGFNARYVHIVESALNDSLTRHQRTAGGGYGRRTGERHHTRPVPLPFHLYGQLAHHRAGFDLVRSRPELAEMIRVVRTAAAHPGFTPNLLQLKTALWALANVGRTGLGLAWLRDAGVVAAAAALAAGAASLSARATAVLALGLLGSTPQGAAALAPLGWHCVCRRWTERWTVDEEKMELAAGDERAELLSMSSMDSGMHRERTHTASEGSQPLSVPEASGLPSVSFRSATLPAQHSRSLSDAARPSVIPEMTPWQSQATQAAGSSTESLTQPTHSPLPSGGDSSSSRLNELSAAEGAELAAPVRPRLPSVSVSMSPPSTYPSEEDAQGYNTLQGVTGRLRRDHSHHENTSRSSPAQVLPPARLRQTSLTLDTRHSGTSCGLPSPGSPPGGSGALLRASSRRSSITTVKRYQLQRGGPRPTYVGIALPLDLATGLLTPPPAPASAAAVDSPDEFSDPLLSPREVSLSTDDSGGLEFHSAAACLRCFTLKQKQERRPRHRTDTESSTESCQQLASPPAPDGCLSHLRPSGGGGVDIPSSITSVGSATSLASHEQLQSGGRPMTEAHVRVLVRRELLRLVTALSSSVGARAAEQGLLSLKQKFSGLLRTDLCLYSEVHHLLGAYEFRQSARRFMQELFEDMVFEEAKSEALWIMGRCRQERLDQTFESGEVLLRRQESIKK